MKYFLIILLGFCLIYSCEEDDICVDEKTPQLYVKFEDEDQDEDDDSEMDSIIIYRKNFEGTYELVIQQAKTVAIDSVQVALLLEEVAETELIISKRTYDITNYDTLTVNYVREVEFGSKACGYKVNYLDTQFSITDNFFIALEQLQPQITNEENPHILLYY